MEEGWSESVDTGPLETGWAVGMGSVAFDTDSGNTLAQGDVVPGRRSLEKSSL